MKRRVLSWIAIVLTAGAFILLCLIWLLKINILIPILMFAAALVILGIVKNMPSDEEEAPKNENAPSENDGDGSDH